MEIFGKFRGKKNTYSEILDTFRNFEERYSWTISEISDEYRNLKAMPSSKIFES